MQINEVNRRGARLTVPCRIAAGAVALALLTCSWSGSAAARVPVSSSDWLGRIQRVRADGFSGDALRQLWRDVAAVTGPDSLVTWDGSRLELVVADEDAPVLDQLMGSADDLQGVDIVASDLRPTPAFYSATGGDGQAGKHLDSGTMGWIIEVWGFRKAITAAHATALNRTHYYNGTGTPVGSTDSILGDFDAATIRLSAGSTGRVYGLAEPIGRILPENQILPGLPIWFSGKKSGINRPGTVTKLAAGLGTLWWCTTARAGAGDSGGPVFGRENGKLTAAGMVSGGISYDPNCGMAFVNLDPILRRSSGTLVK